MSASTPEGKVKKKINKMLDNYKNDGYLYYYMSVPSGYGKQTVDYLGCMLGRFFAIEAKRDGEGPTALQEKTLDEVTTAKGKTFVVNDDASLAVLDQWLAEQLQ